VRALIPITNQDKDVVHQPTKGTEFVMTTITTLDVHSMAAIVAVPKLSRLTVRNANVEIPVTSQVNRKAAGRHNIKAMATVMTKTTTPGVLSTVATAVHRL